jgi:hypothetical protein
MYFMDDPEHVDFETRCDCFVYKREIKTEKFSFGRVEFVDTSEASGCVKEQLRNVYLLYQGTFCVAVYNEHPKKDIQLIETLIKEYHTDTTKLAGFARFDSSIRISVDRLCRDTSDNNYYGDFVDWREIEYSTLTKPFKKNKDSIVRTWYKWTE